VTSTLERGDEVALEVTWQGTMTGPWGDTPATGRRQTSRSAMFMRFSGDGVSECRQYFDVLTILEQLGIAPG
jgi:predicted ester cyclase